MFLLGCYRPGGKGIEGVVTELLTPGSNSARSTMKVKWNSGGSNVYRVGYKGKVDIRYTEESPGGECYPQHLPVFGEENGKREVVVVVGGGGGQRERRRRTKTNKQTNENGGWGEIYYNNSGGLQG